MVHGPRSTVHGPRSMVHGPWSTKRSMDRSSGAFDALDLGSPLKGGVSRPSVWDSQLRHQRMSRRSDFISSRWELGAFDILPLALMAEAIGTVASILQLVDTALRAREYLKDFHDAPKGQQKLFSELQGLQLLFSELLKRLHANPSSEALQQISGPLTVFQTTMTDLTKKLGPREGMSKFTARLTWTLWNKKETAGYLEELERIKVLINVWLTMGIWYVSAVYFTWCTYIPSSAGI
ncbi:hypothetical protein C8R45DRAFT_931132 [Mycena sanguinolenta]|nr:hypothetical protein C8R45DRAFT_931132 [Mycena sanguinolenta]